MHPSLFCSFVAAARYPDPDHAYTSGMSIHGLGTTVMPDDWTLTIAVIDDDRHCIVVVGTGLLPESLENDIVTQLGLPPGEIFDPHSDVVAYVMAQGANARDALDFMATEIIP